MGFLRKTLRKEHLLDRGIYSDAKGHIAAMKRLVGGVPVEERQNIFAAKSQ